MTIRSLGFVLMMLTAWVSVAHAGASFDMSELNDRIDEAADTGETWPFDPYEVTKQLFGPRGKVIVFLVDDRGDGADVAFTITRDEPESGIDYFEAWFECENDNSWRLCEILSKTEIEAAKTARTGAYGSLSTLSFIRFSLGDGVDTFDTLEGLVVESLHGSAVEFEFSPVNFVPLAFHDVINEEGEEDTATLYNFRGVANVLAWGLSSVLADSSPRNVRKVLDSPWHFVLFAPDCRVRMKLVGNLKLQVGTRTDYLLYRTAQTERGIIFTPHIGLDFSGGDFSGAAGYGGLSVSVGYRNTLNFDGENHSDGPALTRAPMSGM